MRSLSTATIQRIAGEAAARFANGAVEYGEQTWQRPVADVMREAQEECLDGIIYVLIGLVRTARVSVDDPSVLPAVREQSWLIVQGFAEAFERLGELAEFAGSYDGARPPASIRAPELDMGLHYLRKLLEQSFGQTVAWSPLGDAVLATEVRRMRRTTAGERQKTLNMAARRLRPAISAGLVTRERVELELRRAAESVGLDELAIRRALTQGLGVVSEPSSDR